MANQPNRFTDYYWARARAGARGRSVNCKGGFKAVHKGFKAVLHSSKTVRVLNRSLRYIYISSPRVLNRSLDRQRQGERKRDNK